MPSIEPKDADKLWEEDWLKALEFAEDQNPFDLNDRHPVAKLRQVPEELKPLHDHYEKWHKEKSFQSNEYVTHTFALITASDASVPSSLAQTHSQFPGYQGEVVDRQQWECTSVYVVRFNHRDDLNVE